MTGAAFLGELGSPEFAMGRTFRRFLIGAAVLVGAIGVGWLYFVFQSYEKYTLKSFVKTLEQPSSEQQNDDISKQMREFFVSRNVDFNEHNVMKKYFPYSGIINDFDKRHYGNTEAVYIKDYEGNYLSIGFNKLAAIRYYCSVHVYSNKLSEMKCRIMTVK